MGAGFAYLLGRIFHLTKDQVRLIAPIGAAAGIGPTCNTPIAAVLFVMEEVVAAWNVGVLGLIVLVSVSAVLASRWLLGDEPLCHMPEFELVGYSDTPHLRRDRSGGRLPVSAVPQGAIPQRARISSVPDFYRHWLPAIVVGAVGTFVPETLGAGTEVIDEALHDLFA